MPSGFEQRLASRAASVNTFLQQELRADRAVSSVPERLQQAVAHAVLGGGKRLRPFLLLESASLFDVPEHHALPIAAALECVHCYSLVHDDLPAMDNDRLRRGQPTVWAQFDEWTAILAGDALLTLAFELISEAGASELPAETRCRLVRDLARASGRGGMVGGQCIDLEADKLGEPANPDEAHVRRLQEMKTGALILFAVEAGATLAGAGHEESEALRAYGRALGLAFQIADDILDAEGDSAVVGKATGKDAEAGKATLISILGLDAARRELESAHAEAVASLSIFGAKADMLRSAADFIVARDR